VKLSTRSWLGSFWTRRYARKCVRRGEPPPKEALILWFAGHGDVHFADWLAEVRVYMLALGATDDGGKS
jgi:hypothetical protein